jgi:hypothetical protein
MNSEAAIAPSKLVSLEQEKLTFEMLPTNQYLQLKE